MNYSDLVETGDSFFIFSLRSSLQYHPCFCIFFPLIFILFGINFPLDSGWRLFFLFLKFVFVGFKGFLQFCLNFSLKLLTSSLLPHCVELKVCRVSIDFVEIFFFWHCLNLNVEFELGVENQYNGSHYLQRD